MPQLCSGLMLLVAGGWARESCYSWCYAGAGGGYAGAGGYDASYGLVAAIWPGSSGCLVAIGWRGWHAGGCQGQRPGWLAD